MAIDRPSNSPRKIETGAKNPKSAVESPLRRSIEPGYTDTRGLVKKLYAAMEKSARKLDKS